jgi:hypothetical protein
MILSDLLERRIKITRLSKEESEEMTSIIGTPSPMQQSSYMGGATGTAGQETDPTVGSAPYLGRPSGIGAE